MRRRVWRYGFALALALTVLFAARGLYFAVFWSHVKDSRETIEPWMTPRYIARSWGLSHDEMRAFLDAENADLRGVTLARIAKDRGIPVDQFITDLTQAMSAPE